MAFEGSENLINVLTELRELVDLVVVAYQDFSYDGDPISDYDMRAISYISESGLSDVTLKITTDISKPHREQETDKRNQIMEYAEKHGCSHVLIIDADEFYTKGSFLRALEEIDENDYEQTYCQYVNYYHDYMHYMVYPFKDGMHVPFVTKSCYRFSFECSDFERPSDPTRRYMRPKDKDGNYLVDYYVFPWNVIKMHHFSWIRRDIRNKLRSWSSKKCFNDIFVKTELAVQSYNEFDTEADVQDAKIIFNTPDNKIQIRKFPRQYVFPEYTFTEIDQLIGNVPRKKKQIVILNLTTDVCDGLFNRLEQTCRETWKTQIEKFGLGNISYYTVRPGAQTAFYQDVITVKDIQDNRDDVYQMLNRFTEAVRLLDDAGIHYDYIIRTNTSTWLNLPLIDSFLKEADNVSEMYGFRFDSAFWSQYNPYLEGQVLVMSRYIVEMMKYYLKVYKLGSISDVADDVVFGAVFSANQNRYGLPSTDFMKVLYGSTNNYKEFDILKTPAVQVKEFFTGIGQRMLIEPERMKQIQTRFDSHIQKYNTYTCNKSGIWNYPTDSGVQGMLQHKDDIILNVIEDTKAEWIPKSSEYKEKARFRKAVDFTGKLDDMEQYIQGLKRRGGYLK